MHAMQNQAQPPLAVPVAEAARMLGIGLTKTYALINEGKLVARHVGARRVVTMSSMRRLIGDE